MTTVAGYSQMLSRLLIEEDARVTSRERMRRHRHDARRISRWLESAHKAEECASGFLDQSSAEAIELYRECLKQNFDWHQGDFVNPALRKLNDKMSNPDWKAALNSNPLDMGRVADATGKSLLWGLAMFAGIYLTIRLTWSR